MGFALAGFLAQAGRASQLIAPGHGRGGLQVQLDLAGHADPGQVAFGNPMLLTDAAEAVGKRTSPAHQRGFMFRADRIQGTLHDIMVAFFVRLVNSLSAKITALLSRDGSIPIVGCISESAGLVFR